MTTNHRHPLSAQRSPHLATGWVSGSSHSYAHGVYEVQVSTESCVGRKPTALQRSVHASSPMLMTPQGSPLDE